MYKVPKYYWFSFVIFQAPMYSIEDEIYQTPDGRIKIWSVQPTNSVVIFLWSTKIIKDSQWVVEMALCYLFFENVN